MNNMGTNREKKTGQMRAIDQLRAEGLTVQKACKQVGLKDATYAYWKEKEKAGELVTPTVKFTDVSASTTTVTDRKPHTKKVAKLALVIGDVAEVKTFLQEYFR